MCGHQAGHDERHPVLKLPSLESIKLQDKSVVVSTVPCDHLHWEERQEHGLRLLVLPTHLH